MCGGDDIAPTTCTSNKLNSRAGEDGCYPYQFTYPFEFVNQAEAKVLPDITDIKIVNYITPGAYNFIGGDYTAEGGNLDCPTGHQCIYPDRQVWTDCPSGSYSSQIADNVWACEQCPVQMYCPLRGDDANAVSTGYFSPFGVHLPLPVRAGWVAGPGSPIEPCPAGTTSDDFGGTCYTCQKGEVCSFPSNRRMVCNEGRESLTTGLFTCDQCPVNTVFNTATQECAVTDAGTGALHPMLAQEKCKHGWYSDSTSISDEGNTDCQ